MAKMTEAQMKSLFIQVLTKAGGKASAADIVKGTKLDPKVANGIAKALVAEGRIKGGPGGVIVLVAEKKAPAKAAPAPAKKKVAKPVEEEVEFDLEDDDAEVEVEDDEDAAEFDLEDADEDGVEDPDDDDVDAPDDDEDEAPAPKKGKAKAKAQTEAAHEVFSMPFKTIDTLTDEELAEREEMGVAAAESLFEQGHELPAELIMRSVAKVRRQIRNRG